MADTLSIPFSEKRALLILLLLGASLCLFAVQMGVVIKEDKVKRGATEKEALAVVFVKPDSLASGFLKEHDLLIGAKLLKDKHLNSRLFLEPYSAELTGINQAELSEILKRATKEDSVQFLLFRKNRLMEITFSLDEVLNKDPFLVINTHMHHSEIRDMALNRDKKTLVTVSYDKTMKIWNSEDLTLKKTLRFPSEEGNTGKIVSVAISNNGSEIACSVWGGDWESGDLIFIIDAEDSTIKATIRNLENTAFDLEFSQDDEYLLAAIGDINEIKVFQTSDYSLVAETKERSAGSNCAIFLDSGNKILSIGNDSALRLYNLSENGLECIRTKSYDRINPIPFKASYSEKNELIAIGFTNGTRVALLDADTLKTVHKPLITKQMKELNFQLHDITWSDNGKTLFAANYQNEGEGGFVAWDDSGRGRPNIVAITSGVLDIKSGGSRVYFSTEWPKIGYYDTKTNQITERQSEILNYKGAYRNFESSEEAEMIKIPSVAHEETLFFNTRAPMLVATHSIQRGLIPPLTYSEEIKLDNWQYSSTPRLNGALLELEKGEISRCVSINPLETGFAVGTDWHIYYYDKNGKLQWKSETQGIVNALNIVKQGKLLLSAMGNGTIEFYRIADGEKLASLFVTKYSDWVFWTPEGYYSKSDFDTPLLGWQRNKGETELSTFYPVDRFYKDFYTPFLPEIILRTMRTASEVFSGINTEEMVNSLIERNTAEKPSSVAKKNETNDKVNLFLVSCGVANYQTEDFSPLNYAIQDAEKIEKAIAEKYKDEYKEIITYSLYDNQFTEENLNNLINTINEKAGKADHIIFFYAGHGTFAKSEKGGDYILKYPDKTGGVAIETLYKTLNSIRAEEITIFLDACNSGSAVDHIIKRRIQKTSPNTAHANRINVITSSKEWESSAEIKALEHGLFTYCLLEAIESTDGFEIDKIANELIKQMTEKSLKYLNELRIPGVFLSK